MAGVAEPVLDASAVNDGLADSIEELTDAAAEEAAAEAADEAAELACGRFRVELKGMDEASEMPTS